MAGPIEVTDAGDPRLDDFTALNDPARRRRVERDGGYFVVEGVSAESAMKAAREFVARHR